MHVGVVNQRAEDLMKSRKNSKEKRIKRNLSLSAVMTYVVVCLVLVACIIGVAVFARMYRNSVEQNAITNSNQVVSQVKNMITNYIDDMSEIMEMVRVNMDESEEVRNDFFKTFSISERM